uniref:Large Terminase n=1 Tax=Siphoviridae sp. ctGz830 TaxID=2827825 RepID=A0A8S5T9D1_9CAUD|nr:MAG TPA: Large Terminase [Siphoviridae sp. ctGz830]
MRSYKYHPFINDWMYKIEQRKIPACKEQKLLMPFLRNILDSPNTEIKSDIIEDGVTMLERYFPFKLHDYQRFRFAIFYGLYEKGTDFPIFNENFNLWGRGTGKNGTASADAFYLVSEKNGIRNYNVDFVANSERQALTSFNEDYDVIDSNSKLRRLFDYNKTQITYEKTNSTIGFLTANAKTKDGGRQGCIIFDEVHQYENYNIISVLIGGLGKVAKPRIIYLTTDGTVRESVIDDLKAKSLRILNGEEDHNGFFPFIFKLDSIQEVGKKELWCKAIPRILYDETLKRQVTKEYNMMNQSNELKEAFITKRMNIPYVSKVKTVCTWEDLMFACQGHKWIDLVSRECIGSIDFADLRDFASAGLRWKVDGKTYFKQHTWIHEKSLQLTEYNIDINECVQKGWATIVPADKYPTIPAELLGEWFQEQAKQGYYISKIKGDSFRLQAVREKLDAMGLPEIIEVRNGAISHSKVAPIIDLMFANQTVVFEDDKLLRWYIWNVKREVDKKGNVSYTKIEPIKRKTDGFFCFLHSLIDDDLQDNTGAMFFDVCSF